MVTMNRWPTGELKLPWQDIEASRRNRHLQKQHPTVQSKKYRASVSRCPGCQMPPDQLSWFYFESPKETWRMLCGTAGWVVVCDKCRRQVQYFDEVMS